MNTVETIKSICKERKIPVSRLESECGFSNGYIRGLKTGKMPADRLVTVSKYLDLPLSCFLDKEEDIEYYVTPETAAIAQEIFENKELRLLFDSAKDADPSDLQTVHEMLLALKRKERHDG